MAKGERTRPRRPERASTDAGLRAERRKTDLELRQRRTLATDAADDVVRTARTRAKSVLDQARRHDDEAHPARTLQQHKAVERFRGRADETLRREYAAADAKLSRDRAAHRRALASLLSAEREVTDQRLLAERAEADQLLGRRDQMLAVVSHDLRSLLAAIVLNTELIESELSVDAGFESLEAARTIKRTSAAMSRLLSDLLDVASIDAGKLQLQRGTEDLAGVVAATADAFRTVAAQKAIAISVENRADGAAPEPFDEQRILQVLANLLGNAIKFTPAGGRITISVKRARDGIRVAVTDTGPGVAKSQLEKIFLRFEQVQRSDRHALGLGLYIAKAIVEGHGGTIWAESERGRGSTFCFTMPRKGGGTSRSGRRS